MLQLTLYSRPGCHLCEAMKSTVTQVATSIPLQVEEIDISDNPDLERQYGLQIPVLLFAGRVAAKHRITAEELMRVLAGRTKQGR